MCVNEDEPEYGHEDDAAMWDELPAGPANPEIPIDPADFVSPLAGIRRYRDPLYTDSDEVF